MLVRPSEGELGVLVPMPIPPTLVESQCILFSSGRFSFALRRGLPVNALVSDFIEELRLIERETLVLDTREWPRDTLFSLRSLFSMSAFEECELLRLRGLLMMRFRVLRKGTRVRLRAFFAAFRASFVAFLNASRSWGEPGRLEERTRDVASGETLDILLFSVFACCTFRTFDFDDGLRPRKRDMVADRTGVARKACEWRATMVRARCSGVGDTSWWSGVLATVSADILADSVDCEVLLKLREELFRGCGVPRGMRENLFENLSPGEKDAEFEVLDAVVREFDDAEDTKGLGVRYKHKNTQTQ